MTTSVQKHTSSNNAWNVTLAFLVIAASTMVPDMASATASASGAGTAAVASGTSALNNTICSIVNALQGPVARGVAACGIIFLGFSLFMGKISWGTALSLGIGLGAIFGAKTLVGLLGAGSADACA